MKTLLISISLLLAQTAVAQRVRPSLDLDKDPVFASVASHRIHYPVKPASRAIYGRFYAGFRIDEDGHIQDISVLYPKMSTKMNKLYGFDYEIKSGLRRMPPLNPGLAGNYILPIAFCFTHYGEGANPIVPTNVLPQGYDVGERILLNEVKIFAKSPSEQSALNIFPARTQNQ